MKFRAQIKTSSFDRIMKFLVSVETHNFLFHPNWTAQGPLESGKTTTKWILQKLRRSSRNTTGQDGSI